MYSSFYYPSYRRWGYPGRSFPWGWGAPYGYGSTYYNSNIIGSAIANQNMNIVGGAGVVANQYANPIAIW